MNIFSKLLAKFPNSQFHKEKTILLMSQVYIWNANINLWSTLWTYFHNIISHVTKWNSNTNPMKKFIFHAFLIPQNWKNETSASQACQITHYTNALRHLHHILVHQITTPNERKRKRKRKRKHLLLIFTWWWWW